MKLTQSQKNQIVKIYIETSLKMGYNVIERIKAKESHFKIFTK